MNVENWPLKKKVLPSYAILLPGSSVMAGHNPHVLLALLVTAPQGTTF
jgi:hypothetical protein